ncbi:MAG: ion transporter, partial [Planctomycetota bacterium]|nr:ion transporter [Planctomycetota bacterium]
MPELKTTMRAHAEHPRFGAVVSDRVVVGVIALNAALLFALAFPGLDSGWRRVLLALDMACLAYFALEMVVKIRILGWVSFWSRGINRFDLFLVLASLPGAIIPSIPADEFSLILLLRLSRLLRFVRVLRFIPESARLLE